MKNFKNFRRNKHRNNIRSFKSNTATRFNGDFNMSGEFKRKKISKNINASKLIEKYTELAKEALSNGDKILSENYYQHADHFTRISEKQNEINSGKNTENYKETNFTEKKTI
tara:strand:- start:164 stop:499 length:336 start_codon:yes stop_codon:yes gene_type:complete